MIIKFINKNFHWLLILLWIAIFLSINTGPDNFIIYDKSINKTINLIRASFPIISMIITFGLIIFFVFIQKKKISYKENKIFFLFLIFAFIQFLSLINVLYLSSTPSYIYKFILTQKEINLSYNISNYQSIMLFSRSFWLISSISAVSIIFLLNLLSLKSYYKHFFYASILIIAIVVIIFIFPAIIYMWNSSSINLYSNAFLNVYNKEFIDEPIPRATGISRSLLIIYIFVITFFYSSNIKNNFLFSILFIGTIFMGTLILGYQSRIIVFSFFLFNFLIFLFFYKKNFKKRMLLFISFSILPIAILYSLNTFKNNNNLPVKNNADTEINSTIEILPSDNTTKPPNEIKFLRPAFNLKSNIYRSLDSATSGRTRIWKNLFKHMKEKYIIGYGPQADRYIISSTTIQKLRRDTSASNALIYSQLCAGIFGSLVYFLLILFSIYKCYYLIFKKKIFINSNNICVQSSLSIIIFLILRSIVESGFMIFGIDFMLFVICFSIIDNYNEPKKMNMKINFKQKELKVIRNFTQIPFEGNFILSGLNLASTAFLTTDEINVSENLIFWPDGIFAHRYETVLAKIPGRDIIKYILIPESIDTLHVIGNLSDHSKVFLELIYPKKKIKISSLPYGKIDEIKKKLPKIYENELCFITLPTPKQEQIADYYIVNKKFKIICIGGSINIASGDEKVCPKIIEKFGMEFLWRLRTDTRRRFQRLLISFFLYIKSELNGSFKKFKVKIIS